MVKLTRVYVDEWPVVQKILIAVRARVELLGHVAKSSGELGVTRARAHARNGDAAKPPAIDACVRVQRVGAPELDAARITESGLHHADDLVGRATQLQLRPDDRGVRAELAPEVVCEHDDAMLSVLRLVEAIETSEVWRHPKDLEEAADRARARESLGLRRAREDRAETPGATRGVEDVGPRRQRQRLRWIERCVTQTERREVALDESNAREIGDGQGPEQNGIHRRENGGVGPDAEPEGQQRDQGERRSFRELAKRKTNISAQGVHPLRAVHGGSVDRSGSLRGPGLPVRTVPAEKGLMVRCREARR